MKNLKKRRDKINITQVRLSVAIEVSLETVSAYESGKALPSADTLIKMAKFLNTSTNYLLGLTNNDININDIPSHDYDELLDIYTRANNEIKKDILTYAKIREKM